MFLQAYLIVCVLGFGVANVMPPSVQHRIIGGEYAGESYAPHMAVLVTGERRRVPLCGASLISASLALTAAHCVDAVLMPDGQLSPFLHIRVGSNRWDSGGTVVYVKDYHNHPKWDPDYIKYDAGVLVLRERLVLSGTVAVVQLGYHYVGGNERTLVTGWGRTGPRVDGNIVNLQPTPYYLQLLRMSTISHEQCQRQMRDVATSWTPHIQDEVEICTFHSRGHGMCVGDSGSALIEESSGKQIGVVSWGFGCAEGAPDVYVRVSGIWPFLEKYLHIYKD